MPIGTSFFLVHVAAQVGPLHVPVRQEVSADPSQDDPAGLEDVAAVRDAEGGPGVLLDEEDGAALGAGCPDVRKMSCTTSGASPMDGSSSMSSQGRAMSAPPMASICCSPPERVPASWRSRCRRTGKSP